jgi:hypothetical protein
MERPLVEKIQISIPPDLIAIQTPNELLSFLSKEMSFWRPLNISAVNNLLNNSIESLNHIITQCQNLQKLDETQHLQNSVKAITDEYLRISKTLFYSNSPEGQFILKQAQRNENCLIGAINYFYNPDMIRNQNYIHNSSFIKGFVSASIFREAKATMDSQYTEIKSFIENDFAAYEKTANDLLGQYKTNITNLESEKTERLESLKKYIGEQTTGLNDYVEASKKKVADYEKHFKEELQLKEPAKHWGNHAIWNQIKSILWLLASVVIIVVIGWILIDVFTGNFPIKVFNLAKDNTSAIKDMTDLAKSIENIKGTLFVTLIISLLIYLLRLTVKYSISAQHLAYDASERRRLTYFYLSLKDDSTIEKEEKLIVFQALFSRSDSGLFKEDHSPTLPEAFLQNIIPQGKGKQG